MDSFRLNQQLDVAEWRRQFMRSERIQIADFLEPECASFLQNELVRSRRWRRVINGSDQVFEISADDFDSLDPGFRAALNEAAYRSAAFGFQYQYDSIRVSDAARDRVSSPHMLDGFASFMSTEVVLDFFRAIVGYNDIRFADAQATRYRSGDFLTRHDDAVAGKDRRLAYVLSLVNEWRPEWGGLLTFIDQADRVTETFVPRFNSLSLFAVGQQHYVSPVVDFSPVSRVSITGWLRTHESRVE